MWFDDDSPIWPNESLVMIMVWCCKKATHKKRVIQFKTGKGQVGVSLEPGQLIFGRHKAAKQLKMNPETVRKRIKKLIDLGFITMQSTSQYSILTINNYNELYNIVMVENTSKSTRQVPGKYQASTTKKNLKTLDNVNKESLSPIVPLRENEFEKGKFDKFINLYPNAVAKEEAWKAWQQLFVQGYAGKRCTTKFLSPLTDDLFGTIINAVKAQTEEREWKKKANIWKESWSHPATWLRAKRWEDKVEKNPQEEEPEETLLEDNPYFKAMQEGNK
jgi:DNA-binding transcriptional regulator YhcF (GntR family)